MPKLACVLIALTAAAGCSSNGQQQQSVAESAQCAAQSEGKEVGLNENSAMGKPADVFKAALKEQRATLTWKLPSGTRPSTGLTMKARLTRVAFVNDTECAPFLKGEGVVSLKSDDGLLNEEVPIGVSTLAKSSWRGTAELRMRSEFGAAEDTPEHTNKVVFQLLKVGSLLKASLIRQTQVASQSSITVSGATLATISDLRE